MSFSVDISAARRADPLRDEREELLTISATMESAVPQLADKFGRWRDAIEEGLKDSQTPFDMERTLEMATRNLRHVWLGAAASSTSKAYRSPVECQVAVTPSGCFHNFGYERDLQPDSLERRCLDFFPPPSDGRACDHILFSSGQAAMNAVLTYISSTRSGIERLKLRHLGSYFETVHLLALFGGRFDVVGEGGTCDVLIAEPLSCDGAVFRSVGAEDIASVSDGASALIVDSTLVGLDDALPSILAGVPATTELFRTHSGLKLFQQGLELADVGIVSVYGPTCGEQLRRIRTLQGTGLRLADVAALEIAFFLDQRSTRIYEDSVFSHNAKLACLMQDNPGPFGAVTHPALDHANSHAPFCIFSLKDRSRSYDDLQREIILKTRERDLVLDKGGSFGFRGHRFEVVRPEGREPFLRVALGHRSGPSLEGILTLFNTITG